MKTIKYKNFNIKIENDKGSYREGTDYNGKKWKVKMNHPYGFFEGVKGKDKDELDVFVGSNLDSENIFIVNQIRPDNKKFDEHKVLVGFDTKKEAKKAYLSNYNDDATRRIGSLKKVSLKRFNEWLEENEMKVKEEFVKGLLHVILLDDIEKSKEQVKIDKEEFVDEHKKLVKVLKFGSKKKRKKEADKQEKELSKVKKRGNKNESY